MSKGGDVGDRGTSKVVQWFRGEFQGEKRIGFWHEDLKETRRQVTLEWLRTTLILSTAILGILSIYWGALLNVDKKLKSFDVIVVDFDGSEPPYDAVIPFVGPMVLQAAQKANEELLSITIKPVPASEFSNDPMKVRENIYDFHHWAAIVISSNATALLQEAVSTANSSYDPKGACQSIYVEARDQTAMMYITPQLSMFEEYATSLVGSIWVKQLFQNNSSSINSTVVTAVPQAFSPAIGFTAINLRPFAPPDATPAVSVGLIYLIIVAFFSFSFFLPTHSHFVSQMESHSKMYFGHLVLWKYTSSCCAYFFMSLAYSLVSLAFQIPFSAPPASHVEPASPATAYGHASFIVYWMVNYIGMCALGLACENVAMIIGLPWVSLFLIFWVIVNVSTAFYPLEFEADFYSYGLAFPLHNIVEATKTIMFDVHSRIGLNIGILLAWWAVNTAVFPLAARWFRWVNVGRKKAEDAKQAAEHDQHKAEGESDATKNSK